MIFFVLLWKWYGVVIVLVSISWNATVCFRLLSGLILNQYVLTEGLTLVPMDQHVHSLLLMLLLFFSWNVALNQQNCTGLVGTITDSHASCVFAGPWQFVKQVLSPWLWVGVGFHKGPRRKASERKHYKMNSCSIRGAFKVTYAKSELLQNKTKTLSCVLWGCWFQKTHSDTWGYG